MTKDLESFLKTTRMKGFKMKEIIQRLNVIVGNMKKMGVESQDVVLKYGKTSLKRVVEWSDRHNDYILRWVNNCVLCPSIGNACSHTLALEISNCIGCILGEDIRNNTKLIEKVR